jgi:transposase-like protein
MPCYATIYRWTRVVPEFGRAWRALREEMAQTRAWVDDQRAVAKVWMRAHERRLAGKRPRDWVAGRKSSYTPELGEAVCRAIVEGASLSEVVARPGMPSARQVYRWMRRFPEFRAAYAEACHWREEMLADQALGAALSATPKSLAAARRGTARAEGRMGRLRPRKYKAG